MTLAQGLFTSGVIRAEDSETTSYLGELSTILMKEHAWYRRFEKMPELFWWDFAEDRGVTEEVCFDRIGRK